MIDAQSTESSRRSSGNVLFLILIAVALFAALSYVVTQTARSGGSTGEEKLTLAAAQLLQNGLNTRTVIARMIIGGGVAPEQLNFWWDGSPYAVFGLKGGGIRLSPPVLDSHTTVFSSEYNYYGISDAMAVANIGTSDPEILMTLFLSLTPTGEQLCRIINKKLGIDNIPGGSGGPNWYLAAPGQAVACVRNWNDYYVFYYTLYEA